MNNLLDQNIVMVHKKDITIDYSYQRHLDKHTNYLYKHWDNNLYTPLIINYREDEGKFYVVDGGNRLKALLRMNSIQEIPCILLHLKGQKEEADLFTKLNSYEAHKAVSPSSHMRASIVAQNKMDMEIERLFIERNVFFDFHDRNMVKKMNGKVVKAITMIRKLYKVNKKFFKTCLDVALIFYKDEDNLTTFGPVLRGLMLLEQKLQFKRHESLMDSIYYKRLSVLKIADIRKKMISIKDVYSGSDSGYYAALAIALIFDKNRHSNKLVKVID